MLTRRWIRRYREADTNTHETRGQVSGGRGSSPPSPPPKQTPRSGMLPPVTSPVVSPRTPVELRPSNYQDDRQSRGAGREGRQGPGVGHLGTNSSPGEEARPSPTGALLPSIGAGSSRLPSINSAVSSRCDSLDAPGTREPDGGSTSTESLSEPDQACNLRTGDSGRKRRQMPHVPSLANVMPTEGRDG